MSTASETGEPSSFEEESALTTVALNTKHTLSKTGVTHNSNVLAVVPSYGAALVLASGELDLCSARALSGCNSVW